MLDPLWILLFGHYIGDFALQSDEMAFRKGKSKSVLTIHTLIYTLAITAAILASFIITEQVQLLTIGTVIILLALFAQHWVQDYIKATHFSGSKQSFFVDQALHIFILLCIRLYIYHG